MSNELKGVTGIDKAVNALVADIQARTEELSADIAPLASIITTEDNLPSRKADRAQVNKRRAAFDTERKDIEKRWKTAIAPVSEAYKEAVRQCDSVIAAIDGDLKAFEEKRIQEKRELIYRCYEETEEPEEIIGWYELDEIYNPKWENASYSEKQIRKDMEDAFALLKISYDTLKSLHHEWEEDGLQVLRRTKDLQQAIARMNDLKEQQERIKAREAEEARKAEEARAEAEQKTLEAAQKADDQADIQKKIDEAVEHDVLPARAEEPEDLPFGEADELPFGEVPAPRYKVTVDCDGSDLPFIEALLRSHGYEYSVLEVF